MALSSKFSTTCPVNSGSTHTSVFVAAAQSSSFNRLASRQAASEIGTPARSPRLKRLGDELEAVLHLLLPAAIIALQDELGNLFHHKRVANKVVLSHQSQHHREWLLIQLAEPLRKCVNHGRRWQLAPVERFLVLAGQIRVSISLAAICSRR